MSPQAALAAGAGLLLVAAQAVTLSSHPDTTYSGQALWLLMLSAVVAAALVLTGAHDDNTPVLLLGTFWLGPDLAGALGLPAWLRTVCDAYGWAMPALLLGMVLHTLRRGTHLDLGWRLRAVVSLGVVSLILRVLFVDPFSDPGCWRLCEHNPLRVTAALSPMPVGISVMAVTVVLVALSWMTALRNGRSSVPGFDVKRAAVGCLGVLVLMSHVGLLGRPQGVAGSEASLVVFVAAQVLVLAYAAAWLPGLVRMWRLERRLSRLATMLESFPRGEVLDERLRQATRDSSLTVRYWSPGRATYVAGDGELLAASSPRATVATLVERAGRPVALIDHAGRVDAAQLERAIDPALRIVLENAQLRAATLAELAELTSSRARVVQRAEVERRQLERNLHDGAQQRAVALALMVRMLLSQPDVDASAAAARKAESLARALLVELRRVARGIYPAVLTDAGLTGAVADLAEGSTDVAIAVQDVPTRRYPPVVERTAYLVLQAACADARARNATNVLIRGVAEVPLVLEVSDDSRTWQSREIRDLEDQVQALEGRLTVTTYQDGAQIRLELPCAP